MPEVRRRSTSGELGVWATRISRGVELGAGLGVTVQRLAARRPVTNVTRVLAGATAGLTYIEGTSEESPVVPLPVDAASIVDGLWIVQGTATVTYTGGTGGIRARLVTSALAPLSDWYYGDVNGGAIVPAHFAVFGNSDPVRLQFEALPDTGTVDEAQGQITGYLVGRLGT